MTSTEARPPGPTPPEPSADRPPAPLSPTSLVAAGLAVPGLDLRTARAVVDARAGRRVRFHRSVLGGCAALVLVAGLVLAVDTDEPNDVIADGDEPTTTVVTSTTAAVAATVVPAAAPAATVPSTTVAPTSTVKAPVLTLPPPTIATTTTLPPNQPMSVTLNVVTPSVQVGQTAEVQVLWSDPDLADPLGVRTTSVWGDPAVTFPVSAEARPPCGAPGGPASGTVPLTFRYSTPGTYQVAVQVSACDGVGAYAEDRTLQAQIKVGERPDGASTERVVVLRSPVGVPALDTAALSLIPDQGSPTGTATALAAIGQISTDAQGSAVTMVLVPKGFRGRINVQAGTACYSGTTPDVVDVSGTSVQLEPAQACAAATAPVAP